VRTTGIANVDSTSCGSALIDANNVRSGTYTVVLTYRNHEGEIASAPATLKVS